jgi:hypothetical protein
LFDTEAYPVIVLIIPDVARRTRTEQSLSNLESLYGKVSEVASALDGALPFASDLLSLIVESADSQNIETFWASSGVVLAALVVP